MISSRANLDSGAFFQNRTSSWMQLATFHALGYADQTERGARSLGAATVFVAYLHFFSRPVEESPTVPLGIPVVPFCPFWVLGSLIEYTNRKKGTLIVIMLGYQDPGGSRMTIILHFCAEFASRLTPGDELKHMEAGLSIVLQLRNTQDIPMYSSCSWGLYLRWTPREGIVTMRDHKDHVRVLLYSHYYRVRVRPNLYPALDAAGLHSKLHLGNFKRHLP